MDKLTEQQENEIREAWNARVYDDASVAWINEMPYSSDRHQTHDWRNGYLSGHAAAMKKREEETKAIAWCLGKSGEEIVVQMAALQENAKAFYLVKQELAAAKEREEKAIGLIQGAIEEIDGGYKYLSAELIQWMREALADQEASRK